MKNRSVTLPLLTATLFAAAGIAALALEAAPEGATPPPPAGPGFGGHFREEMLKKFDKDGDGKLSDTERQAAREERRAKWQARGKEMREGIIKRFDKDNDGKLDQAELGEAMKARREMERHREHRMMRRHMMMMRHRHHGGGDWDGPRGFRGPGGPGGFGFGGGQPGGFRGHGPGNWDGPQGHGPGGWEGPRGERGPGGPGVMMREQMLKRFDKDGDGQLSDAERAEARKAGEEMREKFQGMRKEAVSRFDKDGDGQLNAEERKALGDAWEKFLAQQPAPAKPAAK